MRVRIYFSPKAEAYKPDEIVTHEVIGCDVWSVCVSYTTRIIIIIYICKRELIHTDMHASSLTFTEGVTSNLKPNTNTNTGHDR